MTDLSHRYCIIMCGGIGSRFWPYSRQARPKQFIDFFGTGRSLLQMTYDRALLVVPPENVIVVTNAQYQPLVREQLPELHDHQVLCEPARRNTAPCIAWAAWHVHALDPEAQMLVAPSDHLITGEKALEESLNTGFDFVASRDALLTLGIKPTRPETGYGYIQIGQPTDVPGISRVKTFTEKPSEDLARVFVDSGEFYWNGGIFLWRATTIMEALRRYATDIATAFDRRPGIWGTPEEKAYIDKVFPALPGISIDFAVMEKASNVYVETATWGWSDLGTWSALYDHSPKNSQGNVTQGCHVLAYDTQGTIVAVSDTGKLVAIDGLHDYIVADAGDVLLICPQSREQRIKNIVNDALTAFGDKYQ